MFKKLFGQGGGHGGGGGGGGGTSHQPRQMTANSTQKTVDAIQKLGEVDVQRVEKALSFTSNLGCSSLTVH